MKLGISYNRPKFCPNATWNASAVTFASSNTIGSEPFGIFVNRNNTVYIPNRANGTLFIWLNGNTLLRKNVSGNPSSINSLFVNDLEEIYIDHGSVFGRVDKYTLNSNNSNSVLYVCDTCDGLFIDTRNNLFCSMASYDQVIRKSLNVPSNTYTIVAGGTTSGSTPDLLSYPYGIFVDENFNLYVADFLNDRIQRFVSGQLNATTVAGSGSINTIVLSGPTAVVLDAEGYLFIVDSYNHRIIGSGPNGFRCIVACSGAGVGATAMEYPHTMAFDTFGNIFVSDELNGRVQKFLLRENSCGQLSLHFSSDIHSNHLRFRSKYHNNNNN